MLLRSGDKDFEDLLKINVDKELDLIELPKEFLQDNQGGEFPQTYEKPLTDDLTLLGSGFHLSQE